MATERMLTPARLAEIFAARPRDCHKGMFGTVGLFGGCVAYSGAAKLANLACAALRAGCGIAPREHCRRGAPVSAREYTLSDAHRGGRSAPV